jgi:glyoxylase-like metal-dependent hydrolase (beta-lactamase superfamily II)
MVHTLTFASVTVTSLLFSKQIREVEDLAALFPDLTREQTTGIQSAYPEGYPWSFNGTLIQTGEAVVLVDAGFSARRTESAAGILDLLAECDLDAEDISTVVVTHGHGDHVGGLLEGEEPTFPRSQLIVSREERSYWLGRSDSAASKAFTAYDDRTRDVAPDELLLQQEDVAIRGIPLPGHTPGQMGLRITSGNREIRLLADAAHTLFQLDDLQICPKFDLDPDTAAETRIRAFSDAVEQRIPVGLFHYPFPGFGTLAGDSGGMTWHPVP